MDEEITEPTEPTKTGITQSQWMLLAVLGALTGVAIGLSILARKSGQRSGDEMVAAFDTNDWKESLRHFASAIDYRFAGIEATLTDHGALLGIKPPPPPAPVDRSFNPSPEPVSMSGVQVGATEPPPPGPAATSLPPNPDGSAD